MMLDLDYRLAVTLPAGTYYIGDPCYAFNGRWGEFLDSVDSCIAEAFAGPAGIPALDPDAPKPSRLPRDRAVVFPTTYGDGVYSGSNGVPYPVDAGILAAVPTDMADHVPEPGCGSVETFAEDFECRVDSRTGVIQFGHIIIHTA